MGMQKNLSGKLETKHFRYTRKSTGQFYFKIQDNNLIKITYFRKEIMHLGSSSVVHINKHTQIQNSE